MLIEYHNGLYQVTFVRSDGVQDLVVAESRSELLIKLAKKMRDYDRYEDNMDTERLFLKAWKTGVLLAGPEYFGATADELPAIEDKQQLRPVADLEKWAALASSGEKVLLAAMVSFFNEVRGRKYLARIGVQSPCELACRLDTMGREVVAQLMRSYCGW